jgi:hypothetical protein
MKQNWRVWLTYAEVREALVAKAREKMNANCLQQTKRCLYPRLKLLSIIVPATCWLYSSTLMGSCLTKKVRSMLFLMARS